MFSSSSSLYCRWPNLQSYHSLSYWKLCSWRSNSGYYSPAYFYINIRSDINIQLVLLWCYMIFLQALYYILYLSQPEDKAFALCLACWSWHCLCDWSPAQLRWNNSLSPSHYNNLRWANCILSLHAPLIVFTSIRCYIIILQLVMISGNNLTLKMKTNLFDFINYIYISRKSLAC